jgi:lipopolysaccharide/colanic/teichoic acid biosynthesis glycosyltransferase
MLKHTEDYRENIAKFNTRHSIKPGITGLAQVKGYRGNIENMRSMESRVKLDRFYINNWSLLFDIKIIFLTLKTINSNFSKS